MNYRGKGILEITLDDELLGAVRAVVDAMLADRCVYPSVKHVYERLQRQWTSRLVALALAQLRASGQVDIPSSYAFHKGLQPELKGRSTPVRREEAEQKAERQQRIDLIDRYGPCWRQVVEYRLATPRRWWRSDRKAVTAC